MADAVKDTVNQVVESVKDLAVSAEKKVEEKAEGEASKKVAGAANAADPGAEAKARKVEFTEGVIEITEARLEQLARGVDAEEAARPAAQERFRAKLAAAREQSGTTKPRGNAG